MITIQVCIQKSERNFINKVGRLLWSLGGRKCGKRGGGGLYKEKGKCNKESRIEFTVPKLVSLDTPHGLITKFLKKGLKHILLFDSKLDHNLALHAKIRETFLVIKSEGFYGGRKCGKGGGEL